MPSFQQLWNSHPSIKGDAPLLDTNQYPNQCAVNVYAALQRSGMNMNTFTGQLSWQKDKLKYAIRAQELANWLAQPGILRDANVEKFGGKDVFDNIKNRRGIIFFQNYWGPGHQGDHIDLWNGNQLTDWTSWVRIHLYISWEGRFSNFRNSESVWFWAVL